MSILDKFGKTVSEFRDSDLLPYVGPAATSEDKARNAILLAIRSFISEPQSRKEILRRAEALLKGEKL